MPCAAPQVHQSATSAWISRCTNREARRERERESEASLGTEATALEAAVQTAELREPSPAKESGPDPAGEKAAEPEPPTRGKAIEMDMSF